MIQRTAVFEKVPDKAGILFSLLFDTNPGSYAVLLFFHLHHG